MWLSCTNGIVVLVSMWSAWTMVLFENGCLTGGMRRSAGSYFQPTDSVDNYYVTKSTFNLDL